MVGVKSVSWDGLLSETIASMTPSPIRHLMRFRQTGGGHPYQRPQGGFFFWVTPPEGIDTEEMLDEAIASNVLYIPGRFFYVDGGGRSAIRLSYATPDNDSIRAGITAFTGIIKRRLRSGSGEATTGR